MLRKPQLMSYSKGTSLFWLLKLVFTSGLHFCKCCLQGWVKCWLCYCTINTQLSKATQSMHFPIVWCVVYIHFAACMQPDNQPEFYSLAKLGAYVKRRGPSQEGCEYGCNSFTTVPHGSKPVSSGKGINNYFASSYSMQLLCGKLAYLPEDSCSWYRASRSLWEASLCEVSGEDCSLHC